MKENLFKVKRTSKLFKASCLALSALITLQMAMGEMLVKADENTVSATTPKFLEEIKVDAEVDEITKWSNSVNSAKVDEIKNNYDSYSKENPLMINNAAELATFSAVVNGTATATDNTIVKRDFLGKYVKMTADIDLKGEGLIRDKTQGTGEHSDKFTIIYSSEGGGVRNAWSPIGTYTDFESDNNKPFKGTFDGCGNKITNMVVIEKNRDACAGLFGYVDGATIKNLEIGEGSYVVGSSSVGRLVGCADGVTIMNSYVTGDISADGYYAGGLVGYSSELGLITITNSYAEGDVSAKYAAGGLVGDCYTVAITNSYAIGDVSTISGEAGGLVGDCYTITITNSYAARDVSANGDYAGGLVGSFYRGTITNSHTTGDVSVNGKYAGGLVGNCYTVTITNSYATRNVSANVDRAGGLVGDCYKGTITNSYAEGKITASNKAGGLVGYASDRGLLTITNSYAIGDISTINGGAGGLVGSSSNVLTIKNSYAVGNVSTTNGEVGGLVGTVYQGNSICTVNNSYWNEANNVRNAIGSGPKIEGNKKYAAKTDEQMKSYQFIADMNEGLSDEDAYPYIGWPDHTPTFFANREEKIGMKTLEDGITEVKILETAISENENLHDLLQDWVNNQSETYSGWVLLDPEDPESFPTLSQVKAARSLHKDFLTH